MDIAQTCYNNIKYEANALLARGFNSQRLLGNTISEVDLKLELELTQSLVPTLLQQSLYLKYCFKDAKNG